MVVCHFFKSEGPDGEVEIHARCVEQSSFDIAALVVRLNSIGEHPGFLIHYGPRESDMEVSLYRPVFHLAKHLEDKAVDSFQYLITTTKFPPIRTLGESSNLTPSYVSYQRHHVGRTDPQAGQGLLQGGRQTAS